MEHPIEPPCPSQDDDQRPSTLAPSTVQQYQKRGRSLWERAARELDGATPDTLTPAAFADWMLSLLPTLKVSSRRAYRSAAIFYLQGRPDADAAIVTLRMAGITPDDELDEDEGGAGTTRWTRVKSISPEDFDRLVKFLQYRSRSGYAPLLLHWCWAGILTGLRPAEWQGARLSDEDPRRLLVQNSKTTQGRGVGLTRTLLLHDLQDEHMEHVQLMLDAVRQAAAGDMRGFPKLQANAVAMLNRTCRTLWPKRKDHIGLYTFRHQFLANAKNRFAPVEVAALAGHATDETATKHYGRRRNAWTGANVLPLPSPSPGDIEGVRHRLQLFSERMERTRDSAPVTGPTSAPKSEPQP